MIGGGELPWRDPPPTPSDQGGQHKAPRAWAGPNNSREVTNGNTDRQPGGVSRRAWADLPGLTATAEGGPLNVATVKHEPAARQAVALDLAVQCARTAEDNKARDIVILDMRAITPLYDFLLLCTGSSRRQIHTLAEIGRAHV